MKKKTNLSRRKFISNSAKAITLATAVGNIPLYLFGNGCLYAKTPSDEYHKLLRGNVIDPKKVLKAFSELTVDTPAEDVYTCFNDFCLTHFGAEIDPITYDTFGRELEIKVNSEWCYYSERSAVLAWSTTLPAKTYVEYGTVKSFGSRTEISERYYYTHLHYLKNLQPDTLYYYRYVSVDERGNRKESADQTLQTRSIPDAVQVPGNMGSPPYILDKPDTVYLVTENINAPRAAFNIEADNITIDLGGNTVTHGNELVDKLDYETLSQSGVGIRRIADTKLSGITIINGILKQGNTENNLDYYAAEDMLRREPRERYEKLQKNMGRGFSNIEISNIGDVKIAGITAEYRWHQTWGMRFDNAFGSYNIHHNVFLDKGTQMFSRHGAGGSRSLGFINAETDNSTQGNQFKIHHNLVKRTRQNALNGAQNIYKNEIYIDSWAVNSFAISPFNYQCNVYDNKIFMTGYYGCGILWADEGLNVSENFIHMENINTMVDPPYEGRRLIETWGEQDVQIGMRLTNYGTGGQERKDFEYKDNVIFGRSRGNTIMRGTALYSDHSVENFRLRDNKIKIISYDDGVEKAACIVTQGANNDRSEHLPISYKSSVLESDICNVRFGDEYGRGSNHQFKNCKLVKIGNHPNYHTFVFDGGASVFNHVFHDCEFLGGASHKDVYWKNTRSESNYRVDWTLALETAPNANISILDKDGKNVFEGTSGLDGRKSIVLTQCLIRPVEWKPDGEETVVEDKNSYKEECLSPYTIIVDKDGEQILKTIDLDKKITVRI